MYNFMYYLSLVLSELPLEILQNLRKRVVPLLALKLVTSLDMQHSLSISLHWAVNREAGLWIRFYHKKVSNTIKLMISYSF